MQTVTRAIAVASRHGQTFYHLHERNADGTATRCRVNGACKVWKTRPDDFRLPVKYGMYDCFRITPRNAAAWLTTDPTAVETTMTLARWCERFGIIPTHPTTERGAVSVIVDYPDPSLWRLSDYAVSSRSGPVVWLVPHVTDHTDLGYLSDLAALTQHDCAEAEVHEAGH